MGLHKVVSVVEAPNAPSLALMRRLGFRQEGLLRQHDWRASQPIDLVCFGLLAGEWGAPSVGF
jgi:RimJ/RimL family protein N-acetyltransferase